MISVSKNVAVALLVFALASPSYAQVCRETGGGGSGKANMTCDMKYRDQLITCDTAAAGDTIGTRPSCPKKPMPMIQTPNLSYIKDYTPYLWSYPRDVTDPSRPYAGAYALGTPGDTSRTFQIFGNTAPGTKRLASCTAQIKVPTDPTTVGEWAKLIRLQVDNCSNQYLLNAAFYPVQKESTQILSMDDPAHPGKTLNIAGECQPLNTFTETENEYDAGHYLQVAWTKLLNNANSRTTTPSALNCIPCTGGLRACDKEPHLPCGSKLENPMATPPGMSTFPEVRLSSISKVQYENINDPSHPFSPRWDFLISDRDISNLDIGQLGALSPTAAVIRGYLTTYMSKVPNSVFCAGIRNADVESDATKKADLTVEVDILVFRMKEILDSLTKRTLYNTICYNSVATYPHTTGFSPPAFAKMTAGSWCYIIDGYSPHPPTIYAHNKTCWQCFGLSGKVDDVSQHPPCTSQYLGTDLTMQGVLPGGLNFWSRNAQCGANFPKICSDIRRPYTNLNVFKMRYHNPGDKDDSAGDNVVLTKGAAEGMTFKEYFGNHMPYPRIWDTGGVSLQLTPGSDTKFQPPTDTTGQYSTIVGVGREAAAKSAGGDPADHADERCLTQGWGNSGSPTTFGGVTVQVPDPLTSWTELKLYDSRTLRNIGMSCIGRYEKVFKPGSAENMMLLRTGGMWQQLVVTKCDRDTNGRTKNCQEKNYKDYVNEGMPTNTDTVTYIKSINQQNIPQSWRGYMSADGDNKFPVWPGDGSASGGTAGLDNATQGDIILMPNGPKDDGSAQMRGLAKMAFVIETRLSKDTDCATKKDCYVRVLEPDNGTWPDICGSTDTWGEMKTRYYYQPGMLPATAKAEYDRTGTLGDCQETKISHCEQSAWSSLKIYHIRDDKRPGCQNKDKAANCKKDE